MDTDLQDTADKAIQSHKPQLLKLSRDLHANPEIAFEEDRSATAVAGLLRENGFSVQHPAFGLNTAFRARYGTGSDVISICCEYDALPNIGHACGHNVIAAAGIGAALGLAAVADKIDATIEVLGTPAEEHGGGKSLMLKQRAWDESLFSMMVHPGPEHYWNPGDDHSMLGVDRFQAVYSGKASHAAAAPNAGVNALDASTVALVSIGLLRQQLPDRVRVAAVLTQGGEVTNIIPASSTLQVEVRSGDLDELKETVERVTRCLEAGALASGCTLDLTRSEPRYEPLQQDLVLAQLWNRVLSDLSIEVRSGERPVGGSTDMGNVSARVAALHPMVGIAGTTAAIHTAAFRDHAASEEADRTVITSALAMANTAILALEDPIIRKDLRERRYRRSLPSSVD